ncbi:hypothetical protein ACLGI4_16900 [Streptomyces sp. HMX112]|uniref:hypothetical protein n=1 Tax=Streptomyces sp. HMX112 TaxID=3390850 RepID=UPI003A80BB63
MRTALRATALRATVVSAAAVVGVTASATGASATTTGNAAPARVVIAENCVVSQTVPSVFGGWKVTLTNSAHTGATAQLRDEKGRSVAKVDQYRTVDTSVGLKVTGVISSAPVFHQRSQGGDMPWTSTAFPKLPAACNVSGTLVGTTSLPGGLTQKTYKVAKHDYQARLFQGAYLVGHLRPAAGSYEDVRRVGNRYVTLDRMGYSLTWTGTTTTSATPGRYKLSNGTLIKLTRDNGLYGIRVTTPKGTWGPTTYYAKGKSLLVQEGNAMVVLNANGTLGAYVHGAARQTAPVRIAA